MDIQSAVVMAMTRQGRAFFCMATGKGGREGERGGMVVCSNVSTDLREQRKERPG